MESSGHRVLPHTADVIVEAWGGSEEACLRELTRGFAESFIKTRADAPTQTVSFSLDADSFSELAVLLIETAITTMDTEDLVPIDVSFTTLSETHAEGTLIGISVEEVEVVGSIPKGVSHSEVPSQYGQAGWTCEIILDV